MYLPGQNKHIDVRVHFMRKVVLMNPSDVLYMSSRDTDVAILTKPPVQNEIRTTMMQVNPGEARRIVVLMKRLLAPQFGSTHGERRWIYSITLEYSLTAVSSKIGCWQWYMNHYWHDYSSTYRTEYWISETFSVFLSLAGYGLDSLFLLNWPTLSQTNTNTLKEKEEIKSTPI